MSQIHTNSKQDLVYNMLTLEKWKTEVAYTQKTNSMWAKYGRFLSVLLMDTILTQAQSIQ